MSDNSQQKILLVEDEPNIAMLFKYNLTKAGYICETASNGQIGFEKVSSFEPDLIISDIMMPEVDGFEFRKMLLTDSELAKIPFIFLTAKGSEEDILNGYDMDIEEYIIKTSSPRIVLAKIAAVLKVKAKEREKAVEEVHQAADNMKTKVVPDEFLQINGFEVKHWHQTFENIPGGDFIDYIKIDDDRGIIVLGDVMGKKWKAWYFAVAYAGYVRSAVRFSIQASENITPSKILTTVNKSVFHDERIAEVFITLTILLLNNKTKTISYAGAGDLPIIYKSSEVKMINSDGILLGFDEDAKYSDFSVDLERGDEVFLFTDGILESRNAEGVMHGKDRLMKSIAELTGEDDSLEKIKDDFSRFTNGKFEDDVTIIGIKTM
ncbi:MAG: SpoIIE family protein phosphatase [Chlorobi bacterium]|nr:SpoIIE family protein phosphatase [Chlorobiota bacterium]